MGKSSITIMKNARSTMLVQRILVRVNATFTAADSRRVKKRQGGRKIL